MGFVFVLIILGATLVGALCGMGGGVIIKPLLDALSDFTTFQISIISGACVLAMSITSLIKHYIAKTKVNVPIAVFLSIGSIIGGLIGDFLFDIVNTQAVAAFGDNSRAIIKIVQNSLLGFLLILVLVYMIFIKKTGVQYKIKNPVLTVLCGLVLGALSVFLDIGGGPINVCVFVFLFGMDIKLASISSLITIFFAQITKFVKIFAKNSFATNVMFNQDLTVTIFIIFIAVAVIGGLLGAQLNKKLPAKVVNIVYCSALGSVLVLTIYNIISSAMLLA